MRKLTIGLIVAAFLIYLALFGQHGLQAVLFFAPFTMTPFVFIAYLVTQWHSLGSQITFLISTVAYIAWCAYLYVDLTILHLDPQSPIGFLFTGIYAAPALLLLFWIAYAFEWHHQARQPLA